MELFSMEFEVVTGNHPPTIKPIQDRTIAVGEQLLLYVIPKDADGDRLRSGAENLPDNAEYFPFPVKVLKRAKRGYITRYTHVFRWTPRLRHIGVHNITFWMEDIDIATGLSKSRTTEEVTITVIP